MRRMLGGMPGWDRRNSYDEWEGLGLWCTMAKFGVAEAEICLICLIC